MGLLFAHVVMAERTSGGHGMALMTALNSRQQFGSGLERESSLASFIHLFGWPSARARQARKLARVSAGQSSLSSGQVRPGPRLRGGGLGPGPAPAPGLFLGKVHI